MTEASSTSLVFESFLDFLKTLAWCKQDNDVLVAVHGCSPEFIVALSDKESRVFPGGTPVKINKSWLSTLQEKSAEGNPVPILVIWRKDALELWYRRHNSHEFPYDVWQNPIAEAYERECVRMPASLGGEKFLHFYNQLVEAAKSCPPSIPKL